MASRALAVWCVSWISSYSFNCKPATVAAAASVSSNSWFPGPPSLPTLAWSPLPLLLPPPGRRCCCWRRCCCGRRASASCAVSDASRKLDNLTGAKILTSPSALAARCNCTSCECHKKQKYLLINIASHYQLCCNSRNTT